MAIDTSWPSPATAAARPRLRVVQEGAQDCSTCRNVAQCWRPGLEPAATASNLYVCRIQRGIDRDKNAAAFLSLMHPKIRRVATWVRRRTGLDREEIIADIESVVIESLLEQYVMGELVPPIVWLFHERLGAVRHWAVRTVYEAKQRNSIHRSYDDDSTVSQHAGEPIADLEMRVTHLNRGSTRGFIHSPPPIQDHVDESPSDAVREQCQRALAILEDGVTLPVAEYRVLAFCLRHARGTSRSTDWLHQHMAQAFGMSRKDVSRLYGMAYRRLLDAMGLRDSYLKARGLKPPKTRRVDRSQPLSEAEIEAAAVFIRAHPNATVLDTAMALGVTDTMVHRLRHRLR